MFPESIRYVKYSLPSFDTEMVKTTSVIRSATGSTTSKPSLKAV